MYTEYYEEERELTSCERECELEDIAWEEKKESWIENGR